MGMAQFYIMVLKASMGEIPMACGTIVLTLASIPCLEMISSGEWWPVIITFRLCNYRGR